LFQKRPLSVRVPRSIDESRSRSHEWNIDGHLSGSCGACADLEAWKRGGVCGGRRRALNEIGRAAEGRRTMAARRIARHTRLAEAERRVLHRRVSRLGFRAWRTVALRDFNVFGREQDPSSPYSGVLPMFHEVGV